VGHLLKNITSWFRLEVPLQKCTLIYSSFLIVKN